MYARLGIAPAYAAVVAVLVSTFACAPIVHKHFADNLAEGSPKTVGVRVQSRGCPTTLLSVRFREAALPWIAGPTPTRTAGSADSFDTAVWQSLFAGSESIRYGDSFVAEWHVPFSGGAFLGYCSAYRPGEVVSSGTFIVGPAFAVSATPNPAELAGGGSRTMTIRVERFGTFSAPVQISLAGLPANVTQTPGSLNVTGATGTLTLTAAAGAPPRKSDVTITGTASPYTSQQSEFTLNVARPTITSVAPAAQAPGGAITINGTSFDPVCTRNVVRIAQIDVGPLTCTTTTLTLTVPPAAPNGSTQVRVTSNGLQSNSEAFNVTRVTLTSVSPAAQTPGGNITISGTNFDTNCTNNLVTLAGFNVVPGSCTSSALNIQVPASAPLGATPVSVIRNGVASNSVPFTVTLARQPGPFVEITDVSIGFPGVARFCSSGEVSVDVARVAEYTDRPDPYLATFRRVSGNAVIGSVPFEMSSRRMQVWYGGEDSPATMLLAGGGAGFSLCSTGIVLDLDMTDVSPHFLGYRFLRLDTGTSFSFSFNYYSAVTFIRGSRSSSGIYPRIYRSPDGTLFFALLASETTNARRAVVIDRESGTMIGQVELGGVGGSVSATVTNSRTVVVTFNGTPLPGITIP